MGERWIGGIYTAPLKEKKEKALIMLEKLSAGLWLWDVHSGIDSPEQGALMHSPGEHRFKNGGVGLHREEELRIICDDKVKNCTLR